jgi:hypothetical protein
MYNLPRYCAAFIVAFACLLFVGQDVEAKKKRMKDDILKVAVRLGKDREAKFSGEKAMDDETFQAGWKSFVDKLDADYAGNEIKLKKFGSDVRFRKGFAHLMYIALRSQTRGMELKPAAQVVVSRHAFLQGLMLEGSCYTSGDLFPKKVSELMEASPGIPFLLSENLKDWDEKYRKDFKKAYPKAN